MRLHLTGIAVIIFFLSSAPVFAQQTTVNPDILTYQHYLLSQWDSVIFYGNRALDQKTDHYYMRMRLGIAYYTKNNFLTAAHHFERGLIFEPASLDAKKYLYYSYLFTNRLQQAESVIRNLNKNELNNFTQTRASWIHSFHISGGNKFSDQKKVKGNQSYFSASASHGLTAQIQWRHQYAYVKQSLANKVSISQHQYYAAMPWYIHRRIVIMPAVHFLALSDGFTSSSQLAKHLEINYNYNKLSLSFSGSQLGSMQNGARQAGVNLVFYPFGNLNLYHRFAAVLHKDSKSKTGSATVLNFMTGLKITPRFWLEAEGTVGSRTNYVETSGSVIHNTPDIMKEKWALTTMILTCNNQMLYLKLIREHKAENQTGQSFYHNAIYGGYQCTFLK